MSAESPKRIKNISDTARWVARYRAIESARPDALFKDPFAAILAGKHGEDIVNNLSFGKEGAWWLIIRTKVLDDFINRLVAEAKIDSVLNLAAGLDSRPFRMNLPLDFKWFEVDLPEILEYKAECLKDQKSRCALTRHVCDLSDATARRTLLSAISSQTKSCLVITEGLLIYLEEQLVAEIATDLTQMASARFWLLDFASSGGLRLAQKRWNKELSAGNSALKFAPPGGVTYFERFGWKINDLKWSIIEARRFKRQMPRAWLFNIMFRITSAKRRKRIIESGGYLLLNRV